MYISNFFVAFSVLEYALCNYLMRMERRIEEVVGRKLSTRLQVPRGVQLPNVTANLKEISVMAKPCTPRPARSLMGRIRSRGALQATASGVAATEPDSPDSPRLQQNVSSPSPIPSPTPPSPATAEPKVSDEQSAASAAVQMEVHRHLGFLDAYMLNSKGEMRFMDQHLDIAARWLYPIAYAAIIATWYGKLTHEM
uniref:Uncharacterized protein n=1 Tax=Haptolina ericina TaxID=156174 RepID=A0A7S3EV28_9EUKA|mmetsp:Transcript_21230/g.47673  ORF Transcript_21230/g.47673 Transcript_21230/m.47673 type:complete len:196 (+) Transcript_21230:269-856(+)